MYDVHEQDRLAYDALTVLLLLAAWVALGSLVLAIAGGLGERPVRRVTVGVALLAACLVALVRRREVRDALRRRPWLVVVIAAAQVLAAVADEPVGGAYVAFSLSSIGLGMLAARARTVWLCVAVLETVYLTAALADSTPAELHAAGDLGHVVGAAASYPAVALLLLGLRRQFTRFVDERDRVLLEIRSGAIVVTPALARAIVPTTGPQLLGSGPPEVGLTPAEITVVEALADGLTPKQIAFAQGVKLTTIRTHIRHAKRKTGVRTLRELAALPSYADWPAPRSLAR